MNFKNMFIVHRGNYSYLYPENSIPAFSECVKRKLPIELDVHILKDGTVVVFHDDNLKRVCFKNVFIKDLTYDELLKYKLNNSNYSIPTLKNVLDIVDGKVLLDIELKYDVLDHSLENKVIDILKNYKGEYILKSFHPSIVRYLKKLRRKYKMNYKVGQLVHYKRHLLPTLIYANPDFISFNYKYFNKKIFKFLSLFKPILVYTIKSYDDYFRVKDFNSGFIVENYENLRLDK